MSLRRIDPYLAADAMAVHRVALDDRCWLKRTPEGELKGCAIGALFYSHYADVPLDAGDVVEWAREYTGSGQYIQGFDVGFHRFEPSETSTHDYTLGLADGQFTRLIVEQPSACRPALWCWHGREEKE